MESARRGSAPVGGPGVKHGWFLVVDDQPLVRSAFGRLLEIRPCRTAQSVESALEVAGGWDGCIGAIIDEHLGEDANPGHLLARIIRMRDIPIPVALVTGLPRHGLHEIARELSVACFEKPLQDSHLRGWVCEALGREHRAGSRMIGFVRDVAAEARLSLRQTDILMARALDEPSCDYRLRVGLADATYRTHAARVSGKNGGTLQQLAREVRARHRAVD